MGLARAIRHLRDYIAIPSVNPMRRDDVDASIAGERRYAEHLREQLRGLGLDAELLGPDERPSVVAEARAPGATSTLLVASHLDTVPVDGMEIDPFDPKLDAGRVYGRGACDTKSGMAALVAALEGVLASGTLRRNLIVVGEADEELGSVGAHAVLEHLKGRADPVDWALATEPTGLRLVTRHKGVAHASVVASGIAGHSSAPERGRNAIVSLARAVLAIDALASELALRRDPHLGPATLSIGLTAGGSAANVIPDHASLVLDRRLLPGESAASVRAELERALEPVEDARLDWCRVEKAALATDDAHPATRACQAALAASGLDPVPTTAAFGTDGGIFCSAGLPSVVLGPGSIEQAHTSREWVEAAQVETMVDLFRHLLENA
jgi:acetylornithine deacetylase